MFSKSFLTTNYKIWFSLRKKQCLAAISTVGMMGNLIVSNHLVWFSLRVKQRLATISIVDMIGNRYES